MKAVIEWRKNNIWLWAVGGRGKWITHIFYVPVVFLLQCDSESDIDDKVRLPFLCLLTCQLKRLRVMNNKWYHDEGGSQSRNMERLKENGGVEKSFVIFIILTEQKKKISRSKKIPTFFAKNSCRTKLVHKFCRFPSSSRPQSVSGD